MKKYEYKQIEGQWFIYNFELNKLGDNGWELVSITIDRRDNVKAYLKREIV